MTSAEIKQVLEKQGKFEIKVAGNGNPVIFSLFQNEGRYSYKVNGLEVGITKEQLDKLLFLLPSNIAPIM